MQHADSIVATLIPLAQRFVARTLDIELREHLGYDRHDAAGWGTGNSRNGVSLKIVTTDIGDLEIRVPRDRLGSFAPVLVPKRIRHLPDLGATVVLLYAAGVPPRLALDRIRALYRHAGHLPELALRSALRDAADWRAGTPRATDRLMVDKLHLAGPVGPIAVYAAIGRSGADIHGLWATSAAATSKPAPEALVGALRRVADGPTSVSAHPSADVVALVRRAWPRATLVTDVHRRIANPFRAEWRRAFSTADRGGRVEYATPRVAS